MAGASRPLNPGGTEPLIEAAARTVSATIEARNLLKADQRILVAFSGGADSTALALILLHLGFEVVLGHVDHRMRPDSEADVGHCAVVAGRLGCTFLYERLQDSPSTEAEARDGRYAALDLMMQSSSSGVIATGHTFDDQAETVLMRKRRGGFALGMPYKRGNVIRPILDLRRAGTHALCDEERVPYLTDPSNSDERFTRNRIRKELAGAGEEATRRLVEEGASHARDVAGSKADLEAFMARDVEEGDGTLIVSRQALLRLEGGVRRQVLRALVGELGVEATKPLLEEIDSRGLAGRQVTLSPGLSVWSEGQQLLFGEEPRPIELPELYLETGKTVISGEWGLSFELEQTTPPVSYEPDPLVEYVQLPREVGQLSVRQWRPGDRFQPLGAPGLKKVHDFFIDHSVPRRRRHRVPLVVAGGDIVWVVGMRVDERAKVSNPSIPALRLKAAWLSGPLL